MSLPTNFSEVIIGDPDITEEKMEVLVAISTYLENEVYLDQREP